MMVFENIILFFVFVFSNVLVFQLMEMLVFVCENVCFVVELQMVMIECDQFKGQVIDLEVKVNSSKEVELQQQFDVMKVENEMLKIKVSMFEECDIIVECIKLFDGKVSDVQFVL